MALCGNTADAENAGLPKKEPSTAKGTFCWKVDKLMFVSMLKRLVAWCVKAKRTVPLLKSTGRKEASW